jgi:hypothetical protein
MTGAQTAASQGYILGATEGEHLIHFRNAGWISGDGCVAFAELRASIRSAIIRSSSARTVPFGTG